MNYNPFLLHRSPAYQRCNAATPPWRRQDMRRRHLITTAIGAAALAVSLLVILVQNDAVETPPLQSPPAADLGGVHLVVSPSNVRSGGSITFVVHNPAAAPFLYGLEATLDRWDGTTWHRAYQAGAALTGSHEQGSLVAPGQDLFVPAIGLQAAPGGSGSEESLPLSAAAPGWYRIGVTSVVPGSQAPGLPPSAAAHPGLTAYGTFRVLPH